LQHFSKTVIVINLLVYAVLVKSITMIYHADCSAANSEPSTRIIIGITSQEL